MLRGGNSKGFGTLMLFLVTGAVLGGIIGEIIAGASLGGVAPYLVKTYQVLDVPPVTVNLYVMKLIIGFSLNPSIISIVGLMLAFLLFRRL